MLRSVDLSAVEQQVAEVWRSVLDVPPGQEQATFFELGGQSISALLIVAWLEDGLGITSIGVDNLFDDPTLENFVQQIVADLTST